MSFKKVVQDWIELACAWAKGYQGNRQDAQAIELALRGELESAKFRLEIAFRDHQNLIGAAKRFPWDQELQEVIEAIIGVFRACFFDIERFYRGSEWKCYFRAEDVLANLRSGLVEACQQWLIGES